MDEGLHALARALWNARLTGCSLGNEGHRLPTSRDQAHAVQREIVAPMAARISPSSRALGIAGGARTCAFMP